MRVAVEDSHPYRPRALDADPLHEHTGGRGLLLVKMITLEAGGVCDVEQTGERRQGDLGGAAPAPAGLGHAVGPARALGRAWVHQPAAAPVSSPIAGRAASSTVMNQAENGSSPCRSVQLPGRHEGHLGDLLRIRPQRVTHQPDEEVVVLLLHQTRVRVGVVVADRARLAAARTEPRPAPR